MIVPSRASTAHPRRLAPKLLRWMLSLARMTWSDPSALVSDLE
jgi:hypothetical protein